MFFVLIEYMDDDEKSWEVYKPYNPPFKTKEDAIAFAKQAATKDGPNAYLVVEVKVVFEQTASVVSIDEISL